MYAFQFASFRRLNKMSILFMASEEAIETSHNTSGHRAQRASRRDILNAAAAAVAAAGDATDVHVSPYARKIKKEHRMLGWRYCHFTAIALSSDWPANQVKMTLLSLTRRLIYSGVS